jgi:hypothetical protein
MATRLHEVLGAYGIRGALLLMFTIIQARHKIIVADTSKYVVPNCNPTYGRCDELGGRDDPLSSSSALST